MYLYIYIYDSDCKVCIVFSVALMSCFGVTWIATVCVANPHSGSPRNRESQICNSTYARESPVRKLHRYVQAFPLFGFIPPHMFTLYATSDLIASTFGPQNRASQVKQLGDFPSSVVDSSRKRTCLYVCMYVCVYIYIYICSYQNNNNNKK